MKQKTGILAAVAAGLGMGTKLAEPTPTLEIKPEGKKFEPKDWDLEKKPKSSVAYWRQNYAKGHKFRYFTAESVARRQEQALRKKNERRAINGLPPKASYSEI